MQSERHGALSQICLLLTLRAAVSKPDVDGYPRLGIAEVAEGRLSPPSLPFCLWLRTGVSLSPLLPLRTCRLNT